jgi:hypothetical protein
LADGRWDVAFVWTGQFERTIDPATGDFYDSILVKMANCFLSYIRRQFSPNGPCLRWAMSIDSYPKKWQKPWSI